MTRKEAVKLIRDKFPMTFFNEDSFVAALEVLGVLKFDPPESVHLKAVECLIQEGAIRVPVFSSAKETAFGVAAAIYAAGYKLVRRDGTG
jgi:hypothetical protein